MQGNEIATRVPVATNNADETDGTEPTQRKNVKLCFRRDRCWRLNTTEEGSMRFLIAVLNRDLICKHRTSSEVDLIDSTMDIVWLGNGNSENIYKFREVYLDQNSSPYFIINKVDVTSDQDEQRRFYVIDQSDVDKLERELKGEPGSDIESDSNSNKDEDEDE